MTIFLILLAVIALSIILVTRSLYGENLSQYDHDTPPTFSPAEDGEGQAEVKQFLLDNFIKPAQDAKPGSGWDAKRARFDQSGLDREFDAEFRPDTIEIDGHIITGDWTLVDGTNPKQRLLYVHGGAFVAGSAISHRAITYNIAKRTGCAVFAPNYRLMPENARLDCLSDSQAAYNWILDNGPDGQEPLEKLAIAGDSAGGNLVLTLSNWARNEKLRCPDAVIAISPAVDSTVSSPSIKNNFETDMMLKPLVGPLLKIPHPILLWGSWKTNGVKPSSTLVSPIMDDLSDLPPTLLHVSAKEMLYDDSRRYYKKATAQGSPVTLQSWDNMCHVWHIFDELLPSAHHAHDEIARFLASHKIGSFS